MKHLKPFNENVIIPENIDLSNVRDVRSLKEVGKKFGFDVVNYDEFYNSLSTEDRKTCPPKHNMQHPIFALFHPTNKKPMIVINNPVGFLPPIEIVEDIIGHEFIHKGQVSKQKIEYKLPNPNDVKLYFSDKNEIMAFSFSIAKDLVRNYQDIEPNELMKKLNDRSKKMTSFYQTYQAIKSNVNEDTFKRYNKYIYMYICEFLKKEDNGGKLSKGDFDKKMAKLENDWREATKNKNSELASKLNKQMRDLYEKQK